VLRPEALSLTAIEIDESHCRKGTYSRPDRDHTDPLQTLRLDLRFGRVLGRNQGPTETYCDIGISNGIESYVLGWLHGNSRLKSLTTAIPVILLMLTDMLLQSLASSKKTKGLVVLDLSHCLLSDETWDAVCDSQDASDLQVLNLLWLESKVSHLA
jgi:hypothetical protein